MLQGEPDTSCLDDPTDRAQARRQLQEPLLDQQQQRPPQRQLCRRHTNTFIIMNKADKIKSSDSLEENDQSVPYDPDDNLSDIDDRMIDEIDNDETGRAVSGPQSSRKSCCCCDSSDARFIMAMLSNFSTSYNVINISLVLPILDQVYGPSSNTQAATLASVLLAGMMLGQVLGGALGDWKYLGRLGALHLVMMLQVLASLGCATSTGPKLYTQLSLWRMLLGVGAGGVYPLAAVLSAEEDQGSFVRSGQSTAYREQQAHNKGLHKVVWTFSMQGVGFVTAPLLCVILLWTTSRLQVVWRLMLGLGSLPGIIIMFMQWGIYQHPRPTAAPYARGTDVPIEHGVSADVWERLATDELDEDEEDVGTCLDSGPNFAPQRDDSSHRPFASGHHQEPEQALVYELPRPRGLWTAVRQEEDLLRKFLGTAGTWFLFDVLFYGNILFQPLVLEAALGGATPEQGDEKDVLQKTALDTLFLTSMALPGYLVAGLLLGRTTCGVKQTPRYVMLQGFALMALLYLVIGINWHELRHFPALLIILYGLTFFFANYGPNTCTFILPSLVYGPECRATLNGLSAACGKLGALAGASLFAPAVNVWGASTVLMICAGLAMLAWMATAAFVRGP